MSQKDLTPEDWGRAALFAWGRGGYRAVAVEPLAKELGVTKGSFYWHFKSRAALVELAMDLWATLGTDQVIARLEQVECPRERLKALLSEAWDRLEMLRVEAAISATALTGEASVRPHYEKVQKTRLDYVAKLYSELGFARTEARRRAIVAYSAYLGSIQIVLLGDGALQTDAQLKRQVALFEELLIP